MRIGGGRRGPWISARTAERLVAGAPVAPEHRRLARLLSAATGPARGHELTGGPALLDAYLEAGRDPGRAVVRPPRLRLVTLSRALMLKAAAVLAAVFVGSAAFAAQTGNLPSRAQQAAHDLFAPWGVPPPAAGTPAPGGAPGPGDVRPPAATTAPSPSGAGSGTGAGRPAVTPSPAPDLVRLRGLCGIYLRHRQYPQSRPLDAAELRTLTAAAGGEANIPGYCAQLTGAGGTPTRGATPPPPRDRGTPPPREGGSRTEPTRSAEPRR